MSAIGARHWACALPFAAVLHAAAIVAVLWQAPPSGARQVGVGGTEIALGPAGGAPGADAVDAPEPASVSEVRPPDTPVRQRPEEAQAIALETETVPEPQPVDVVPVEMANAVAPVVEARPVKPPPPRIKPPPPRVKPKPPEPETARPQEPPPVEPPVTPPETVAAVTPPDANPAEIATDRRAKPSVAGSQGRAGTKADTATGSGDGSTSGGAAGAAADYLSVLQAWLEKHKEYPGAARARRQEGTVLLYFAVDANGTLLADRIEKSSGHRLLDEEAIAMIRRAKPLPPIPDSMGRDQLTVVVPVQFFLR